MSALSITRKALVSAIALGALNVSAQSLTVANSNTAINTPTHNNTLTFDLAGNADVASFGFTLTLTPNNLATPFDGADANTLIDAVGTAAAGAADPITVACDDPALGTVVCTVTENADVFEGNITIDIPYAIGGTAGIVTVAITASDYANSLGTNQGAIPTRNDGSITIAAGPAVGPTVTYAPATGSTVTFGAAASIGGTTAQSITLTAGADGQNGGTTVLSGCSSTVANITFTDGAQTCTAGGACVDGGLDLQCVATNAAQTGTATCTETRQNEQSAGDGLTVVTPRTWNVSCPAADVAPALAYNPTVGTNVDSTQVGQGQTASGTIVVTPSGGSGTSTSTVSNCAIPNAAFTAPAGTLTFTGSTTATQNLTFTCTAPMNGAGNLASTLTCDETIGGGAPTARAWPVTCLEGLPVAAPSVNYAPAANTPINFAAGASVGASVPGSTTVAIDISGGADNGTGAAEQTTVSCSATAGFTVTGSPVGPVLVGDATNPNGTISVSCTSAAVDQVGTLTCVAAQSIDGVVTNTPTTFPLNCLAAEVNITSNPPEGPVSVVGTPSSNVPGSIALSNSGADSTLSCVSSGSVTLGAVPGTIPSGGSATVPYTCLAGAAGAANIGQITCTTQDPGAEGTLVYDVSCLGVLDVPVPAINNLSKVLMVVLVIGLGLIGLGARRQ